MSVTPEELHKLQVWQRGIKDAIARLNAEINASLEYLCISPGAEDAPGTGTMTDDD